MYIIPLKRNCYCCFFFWLASNIFCCCLTSSFYMVQSLFYCKNCAYQLLITFAEIGNAYAVLSNPEKRKQYDLTGNEEQAHNQGK